MGIIIGYTKVAWYLLKCVIFVPFSVLKDGLLIKARYSRPFDYDMIQRIVAKTMLEMSDATVFDWLINPYLKRAVAGVHIPNVSHHGEIEVSDERLRDDDLALLTRTTGVHLTEDTHIKMRWFYKASNFDPKKDPIVYFLHGGGFMMRGGHTAEVFLGHIHEGCPGASIIMLEYTLASEKKDAVFPLQILETLAGYEWLRERHGCQHIWVLGDSAGGNLLLALLSLLQKSARPTPEKAVAISPWLNPTVPDKETFAAFEDVDCFSSSAAKLFSGYYAPDPNLLQNPFLNLEYNFDEHAWKYLLGQTELLLTYGTDEICQGQIKRMAEKLSAANPEKFSLKDNVAVDKNGSHSRLALISKLDLDEWLKLEASRKVITFLNKS